MKICKRQTKCTPLCLDSSSICAKAGVKILTLLGTGGVPPPYQKSALRPSKWPPNDPKFRDFSYFCKTYLKSKNYFFHFSQ